MCMVFWASFFYMGEEYITVPVTSDILNLDPAIVDRFIGL